MTSTSPAPSGQIDPVDPLVDRVARGIAEACNDGWWEGDFVHIQEMAGVPERYRKAALRALAEKPAEAVCGTCKNRGWAGTPCPECGGRDVTEEMMDCNAGAEPVEKAAGSLSSMVIEWVESGLELGTDWKHNLPVVIERRLRRFWPTSPTPPALDAATVERLIADTVQGVSEWDDRTSPEDWPEALLITGDELTTLLRDFARALRDQHTTLEPSLAHQFAEERLCQCGASGSGEEHEEWCLWQSSEWRKWGDAFSAVARLNELLEAQPYQNTVVTVAQVQAAIKGDQHTGQTDLCTKDGQPCYVDGDDAHFRCGTVQCGMRDQPTGQPTPAAEPISDGIMGLNELWFRPTGQTAPPQSEVLERVARAIADNFAPMSIEQATAIASCALTARKGGDHG